MGGVGGGGVCCVSWRGGRGGVGEPGLERALHRARAFPSKKAEKTPRGIRRATVRGHHVHDPHSPEDEAPEKA